MNNEPVAWMGKDYDGLKTDLYFDVERNKLPYRLYETATPLYTHPVKKLTDEEWNKAFDFYCETDEGVLKFDFELRDEWKREQLIRWKEALRKAQENG